MMIQQTVDFNMKFRYSLIITDPQINEKYQNSTLIHPFPTGQNENMDKMASLHQKKYLT